jgi:hypothetical protein
MSSKYNKNYESWLIKDLQLLLHLSDNTGMLLSLFIQLKNIFRSI